MCRNRAHTLTRHATPCRSTSAISPVFLSLRNCSISAPSLLVFRRFRAGSRNIELRYSFHRGQVGSRSVSERHSTAHQLTRLGRSLTSCARNLLLIHGLAVSRRDAGTLLDSNRLFDAAHSQSLQIGLGRLGGNIWATFRGPFSMPGVDSD